MKAAGPVAWLMSLAAAAAILASAPPARGEEFAFYGARFGMTRPELEALWLPLDGGKFALPTPAVRQVEPSFDHEGKMYRLSFAVELPADYPVRLTGLAFQNMVESKWGRGEPDLNVSLEIGARTATVTVTSAKMLESYIAHIEEKLSPLIQP